MPPITPGGPGSSGRVAMASMIEDLKLAVMGRLDQVCAGIAAGGDPEEELARAAQDIEALCDRADQLYRDAVSSMW